MEDSRAKKARDRLFRVSSFLLLCSFLNLARYRGNHSLFLHGVLFVNGTVVSKGEALLAFFKRTQQLPDKIIFIDDREENLKINRKVETLQKPIDYRGVHFLGAQKYPSKEISEQEFEAKWMSLASLVLQIKSFSGYF